MAVNNLPDLGNSIINTLLDPNGQEKNRYDGSDLASQGISIIEGPYCSGKSSMVPKMVKEYQAITQSHEKIE
jgi:hypothetical protein